ncbi:unnamed protein product [Citrullus colocynthis]|uniref:Uncharacterized protein n=1 Tax=Citrullus colocynthis TaxID=252529 RepID=A0ABP0Y2I6_9ROSI
MGYVACAAVATLKMRSPLLRQAFPGLCSSSACHLELKWGPAVGEGTVAVALEFEFPKGSLLYSNYCALSRLFPESRALDFQNFPSKLNLRRAILFCSFELKSIQLFGYWVLFVVCMWGLWFVQFLFAEFRLDCQSPNIEVNVFYRRLLVTSAHACG